jgi:diguanylate cyclase (GGDEF)-like protein
MKTPPLVRLQLVMRLAAALAVAAYYATSGIPQQFRDHWFVALLILVIEAATQVMPFAVTYAGARDEFTADMMVIVAAALLLPTGLGALMMSCGFILGAAIRKDVSLGQLDDFTGQIMCAFLSLTVAHSIGHPGLSVNVIVGGAVAAMLYETLGMLFLTIYSVLAKHVKFLPMFGHGMAVTSIAAPWLISLGILIGVIGWDAPWALPMMGAPLALVFMASRSRVEATEDRSRLDGLLKATTEILAATTVTSVTAAIAGTIAELFETHEGRISTEPAAKGELGVPLSSERFANRYLIAPARSTLGRPYKDHDRLLLETLASVTASALDKAALHEDVTEQATRDALTGLANRRAFENELQSSVIGKRSTDASGVMFLDLDGFKKINDEHGHKAGDEVLVETAKRLLQAVRGDDMVARLGGDEFTVLLRGVHNKDEAAHVAERILAAMRAPIELSSGVEVHPTPSLGVALAAGSDTDPTALLKDADAAMYAAKRAGKDCWRLANDDVAAVVGE